jgi:membrane-bound lytic murein transglycosylase MltF
MKTLFFITLIVVLLPVGKKEPSSTPRVATPTTASLAVASPPRGTQEIAKAPADVKLPVSFARHTGDLDEMVKRRTIRALVVINPIGFFYDGGLPRGVMYEALNAFQAFVNQKLKTGAIKIEVTFLPLRLDQLEAALIEGLGDLIAYEVVITPERARRVAFSKPIRADVTQIIVTGRQAAISSFGGFGGTKVYVNPVTVYDDSLRKVNASLQASGTRPMVIERADPILTNDDLIQMVNAGMIPATVTTRMRADLWAQVLPNVMPQSRLVLAHGGRAAWVMRKGNPQLRQLVDEFVKGHAAGTSFGNTLLRQYLQDTHWITASTSKSELAKFNALLAIFKTYGAQYDFAHLLLAAQGYQESRLSEAARSPGGAVGIMQVLPQDAAANPIDIPDVYNANGNIHAAAKMLRYIADTHFGDSRIDPLNRALFALAGYNAGPNQIAALRQHAEAQGLDPNVWFDNVELIVAKEIGEITVTYVRNIYKYYVAYKLALPPV